MNLLVQIFNTVLYQPLFNALALLYAYLPGHDFGVAVISLTVLIRLILHPLMIQSLRVQNALSEIQPKIKEIQNNFKHDQQKQAEEMMALYKKEKINPFAGILTLFIQLPLIIALYQVFRKGFQLEEMASLYSFVPNPGIIDPNFLGLVNLSQASMFLAVLAGAMQFFQMKTMSPKTKKPKKKQQTGAFLDVMQKQMIYFFPFLTFFILLKLPAAIALYWITTSLFSIGQQYSLKKHANTNRIKTN